MSAKKNPPAIPEDFMSLFFVPLEDYKEQGCGFLV